MFVFVVVFYHETAWMEPINWTELNCPVFTAQSMLANPIHLCGANYIVNSYKMRAVSIIISTPKVKV